MAYWEVYHSFEEVKEAIKRNNEEMRALVAKCTRCLENQLTANNFATCRILGSQDSFSCEKDKIAKETK